MRRSALVRIGVDGAIRWQTPVPLGRDEQGSEVAVGGGRVFIAQDGVLRSFDPASVTPGWTRGLGGAAGQLLTADGLVLVVVDLVSGRGPARVVAHDQRSGEHRWTHTGGDDFIVLYRVRAGLVIAQQRFATVALDTHTGRVRWTAPVPGHDDGGSSFAQLATSASVIVQGALVTTAALDAGTGRRLWARALPLGPVYPLLSGSVAVLTPTSFGGSGPGGVLAVDAATGAHRWTVRAPDESGSVAAAGHGVVLAVTGSTVTGGRTTAVTAETGRILWSAPLPAAGQGSPAAVTAHAAAYIEDRWHDSPGGAHRTISLVNRRLSDGRVLYRRPTAEPLPTGPPQPNRYLPLIRTPAGIGTASLRLFDLATHRVRYTVHTPHWPVHSPRTLSDGSVLTLTADPIIAVGA